MKKSTLVRVLATVICAAAAIACLIWFFRDRLPLPKRAGEDEPEEDLFLEDTGSEDAADKLLKPDNFRADSSTEGIESFREEKRPSRIRRGYIPLKFHESAEL